jgi:uncharacterized protein YndB with AHSA1/START domain
MSATHSIYIEAPVEKVFAWFKDPRNWLTLNPAAANREGLTDVHVTPEGVGTFHVWTIKALPGVRYQCFGVFTEFVPNKRIVDKWSLALEGSETATFDAEGSGTRMTLQCHRQSFWRLWPLNKLADRFEGQESERALAKLKEFMEATNAPLKMAGWQGRTSKRGMTRSCGCGT